MKLTHTFTVEAPVDRVWSFLMDVPTMASCIPGASDVTQVDDSTYDSTVAAKIGPITARFGCRIGILDLDDLAHTGSVEVSGRDSKLGGSVKAAMRMALREDSGRTRVDIESDVDVMGRIGQYGHGMLSKRADAMLADFAACAQSRLSGQG
jgi:carbon monoxide dehydrogenase subunit G